MRYAVIENEEIARQSLCAMVARLRPSYELVFTAESVAETVSALRTHVVDFVIMDVELTDGDCFEIFSHIRVVTPIIFTTSYSEYMLRAFKVNSIDYLLKPITPSDLEQTLEKFEAIVASHSVPDYAAFARKTVQRNRILTVSGDNYNYVLIEDIAWIVSEDKSIFVVLSDGRRRLTEFANLTSAAEAVAGHDFFQVSRSVLAAISAVDSVSKWFGSRLAVVLRAGKVTQRETVSAARRDSFLVWLGGGTDSEQ